MQNRSIEIKGVNKSEAYRYMGFKGTEPDETIKTIIDKCEEDILKVMRPKFVYEAFDISVEEDCVTLEGTTLKLQGNSIKEHLKDCEKVIVMCATLSAEIDKLIRQNEVGNIFNAMVLDALANAAIEQVCDAAELFMSADYPEYNRTWRFGVGYGDFPLDTQKDFLNILSASKLVGVCATDSSILTPRKSVTCVVGLSKRDVQSSSSCQSCNFKDKCAISKEGGSCGGR